MKNKRGITLTNHSARFNVLICFDEKLIREASVLLIGLSECLPNVVLHCITSPKVSKSEKIQMERIAASVEVEIFFYTPKSILGNFTNDDKSQIRFQKLIYNEILPRDLSNLLYLDIDTLPLSDLSDLFEITFVEAFAAVSLDDFVSRKFVRWKNIANAGVILFNNNVWNALNLNLSARDFVAQYNQDTGLFLHSDELVLNRICHGKFHRLPSIYNCTFLQTYTSRYLLRPRELKIIHFIGPQKIWNKGWKSIRYFRFVRIYRSRLRQFLMLREANENSV
jgi:lipopolysaccharide biosynthesis glycosyltransferase